jgi:hypothetical protein
MGDKKSVVSKGREEGKGAGWEIRARQQRKLAPSFVKTRQILQSEAVACDRFQHPS